MRLKLDPNDASDRKIIRAIAEDVVSIMDERKPPVEEVKPEPIAQDAIMNLREVHNLTGVKTQTLRDHIKAGLLKFSRPGKHYLINQKDLNEYLNRNTKI